jgi:hypothetical protein
MSQIPLSPRTSFSRRAFALLLLLALLLAWWVQGPMPETGPLLHRHEQTLSAAELAELREAYTQGFAHPEPGGGEDPCERLRLLAGKKFKVWKRQFQRRGFTMAKVRHMLQHGRREPFTHPRKGTTFTKIYDAQGNWMVVDFVDCVLWQVAPSDFK